MSILTIGGDLRYAHLTALAAGQSMEIAAIGLEKCPFSLPTAALGDIPDADAVILPNPFRGGLSIPFAGRSFTLNDILSALRKDTLLLLSDAVGMPPDFNPCRVVDLSGDSEYILKNAHLTAEAALLAAAQTSHRALMDSSCLIIGCGRIGKRLAHLLHALGADTAVAARREAVREEIRRDGLCAFSMEDLPLLLPRADFIFSTPPAPVLDESLLRLIRPNARLMDLASPPYGFDLKLAHSLSLNASRESGLPGRYCPFSAGSALLDAVRRALDFHMEGDLLCF